MTTNLELQALGSRVHVKEGQLLLQRDLNRMGSTALQSICNTLALLFYDAENGKPLSGFPAGHFEVSSTGWLSFDIGPGFGMAHDPGAAPDPWGPASYRPIVLADTFSGALDAHDDEPRIDVVSIVPDWEGDENRVIHVKDPDDGAFSAPTSNTRVRFSAKVIITKGTPAEKPTAPATPPGHVKVAEALVPAHFGHATWTSSRPVLQLGTLLGVLNRWLHLPFVPAEAGDELEVTPTSPPKQVVVVKPGRAVIGGVCRFYEGQELALATPHASLDRIDTVFVGRDGALGVLTGTPDAAPVAPVAPTVTAAELAHVRVRAGVSSTVGVADITDVRRRVPFAGSLLEPGTITNDNIADGTIDVSKLAQPVIDQDRFAPYNVTRAQTFHGAGFVPSGGSNYDLHADGSSLRYPGSTTGGGASAFYASCPVRLPQGSSVTGLVMYTTPGGSDAIVKVTLVREHLTTGARVTVAEVEFTGGSTARRAISETLSGVLPSVDNDQYAYYLQAHIGAPVGSSGGYDVDLHAVRVTYRTNQIFS